MNHLDTADPSEPAEPLEPPAPSEPERSGERTIGVAIAIPEPYGSELQRWRAAFGDPSAEGIPSHVTLLPPYRVAEDRLAAVELHLMAVAERQRPFWIRLHGTATFRPVSPVVFVALAEGISSCERLADRVRSGPLTMDLVFPYHPHVTIAHDLPDDALDKAYEALDGYDCVFGVQAFSLYEHGSDGVWRPQRDFALGGPLPGPVPPGARAPLGAGVPPGNGSQPARRAAAAANDTGRIAP